MIWINIRGNRIIKYLSISHIVSYVQRLQRQGIISSTGILYGMIAGADITELFPGYQGNFINYICEKNPVVIDDKSNAAFNKLSIIPEKLVKNPIRKKNINYIKQLNHIIIH